MDGQVVGRSTDQATSTSPLKLHRLAVLLMTMVAPTSRRRRARASINLAILFAIFIVSLGKGIGGVQAKFQCSQEHYK